MSVFAGLIIVVFKIKMPEFIDKTIEIFAGSVTAIVLFSLGLFLGIQKIAFFTGTSLNFDLASYLRRPAKASSDENIVQIRE